MPRALLAIHERSVTARPDNPPAGTRQPLRGACPVSSGQVTKGARFRDFRPLDCAAGRTNVGRVRGKHQTRRAGTERKPGGRGKRDRETGTAERSGGDLNRKGTGTRKGEGETGRRS